MFDVTMYQPPARIRNHDIDKRMKATIKVTISQPLPQMPVKRPIKQEEEKKREEQNEKMDTQCVICMCEMVGLELNRAAASSKDRFKIHDGYQD